MEPIRPRPRLTQQQRAALRRMQDFRPVTPDSIKSQPKGVAPKRGSMDGISPAKRPQGSYAAQQQSGAEQGSGFAQPPVASTQASRSKMPFALAAVALVLLLTLGGAGYWWFKGRSSAPPTQASNETVTPPPNAGAKEQAPATIRLIASGDQLPHLAISQAAKTNGGYDYKPFFETVKPIFDKADVRFCNQETVSAGEQYGVTGYPTFNVSKQFARDLHSTGCNVINLANNHINDKGQTGINETVSVWDEIKPLAVAGANRNSEEQQKVRYFTSKGVKFAFVGYAEASNSSPANSYGLNMLNESLVSRQLNEARSQADIVLVSVHWGTEYSDGINAAQDRWAKRFADLGADVVIGTGPHVLEPVKRLPRAGGGETVVWYSLGNLLSAQLDVPSLIGGFAVMDINPGTKKIESVGFLPTYMHYEWTPEQKAREDLLARKNFQLYPLDKAADPLKRSQNNTTVEAQTERVRGLLNTHTNVPILTSDQYFAR